MKSEGIVKDTVKYEIKGILKSIAISVLVVFVIFSVAVIWLVNEMTKVSTATYSSPAGLGNAVFVQTPLIFTDMFLAIDLTPETDDNELLIGRIQAGDGYRFMEAEISKDGTLIAIKSMAAEGNYTGSLKNEFYHYTHAYDFKNQVKIALPYKKYSDDYDDPEKQWTEIAIKISDLMDQRGGGKIIFSSTGELGLKKPSRSKSKRWEQLITEFRQQ